MIRESDVSFLEPMEIEVLYGPDKDGIVVLNKPAGMDTFNTNYHKSGYPQLSDVMKRIFPEGGPPHRIDRGTSGIHVWGSNRNALSMISTATGWKEAHKTYLAVAPQVPEWIYCEVELIIKANDAKLEKWKPCTTGLTRIGETKLVAAELLKGGRTHQIRRAMKSVGLPLDGDFKYGGDAESGGKSVYYQGRYRPRFLLHAWKWKFRDIEVQASLPPDMAEWEPGGFHEPMWTIPVEPLTKVQYDKLAHFRANNIGGSLSWDFL